MQTTHSEDCLIFYAFSPKKVKINKNMISLLENFMNQKKVNDPSDRFNFIAFQNDSPTYLDNFTLDPNIIIDSLKKVQKNLSRANLAGGIFVAITFIIDVFKRISAKVFRLIIITDEWSYKIPSQYIPVLENLIDKVKDMPFIIDVIRLNDYDIEESKKIARMVIKTKGEFYDIKKLKELDNALVALSEKKYITEPLPYSKQKQQILLNNQPFYLNLADEPIKVNKIGTCAICFQKSDKNMVQCPKCETIAHKSCWAQWAKNSNIGMINVFRCHICYNILKLDEQYVLDVQEGRILTEEQLKKLRKKDIVKYMQDLEAREKPKVVHVEDPMAIEPGMVEEIEAVPETEFEHPRHRARLVICPMCSAITTSEVKHCHNCGYQLF